LEITLLVTTPEPRTKTPEAAAPVIVNPSSREPDENPYHSERDRRALEVDAAFVFQIHADAQPGGESWRGSTIFYWGGNRQAAIVADVLAEAMPEELRRGRRGRVKPLPDSSYPRATNCAGNVVASPFAKPALTIESAA
jgi:hypothetical protein